MSGVRRVERDGWDATDQVRWVCQDKCGEMGEMSLVG